MPLTIREATPADLPRLPELFDYNDVPAMIAENTRRMTAGDYSIFLLLADAALLGELHVTWRSDDTRFAAGGQRAYLSAFRIRRDIQGQGLGTHLLRGVIRCIETRGYNEITVGVEDDNLRARRLYERHGFCKAIARCRECYQGDEYEFDLLLRQR